MNKTISLWGQNLYRQFSLMLANQPKLSYYLHPLLNWNKPGVHPDYHSARIVDFRWETDQMLSVWLEPASSWIGFTAGQHLLVTLMHQGRYISRSFSISSSAALFAQQKQIRISCRIQPQGEFTQALAAGIAALRHLSISDAMGDFVMKPNADTGKTGAIVMVAAGSGITPLWSMLSSLRCWTSPIVLFYCVKAAAQAAFLTELNQLAAKQPLFELQLIETATAGRLNLVQRLQAHTDFSLHKALYYFCGPEAMSRQYSDDLIQLGVSAAAIHTELFGLARLVSEGPVKQALFIQQGKVTTVEATAGMPLLQAAEQQGLSPRFGCRIGVCYQCVCQKKTGQVLNLRTGQISGDSPEQIQLCISAAHSDLQVEL
ncbi:iron-sulfur cluster-binding domain-containing protein [Rheinheimera soli]|uniref:Ferredoxin-NADP reductase n=1 Tax=Rheinheimera soli TaxID=443616 RepID=A0ABU1VUM8_9GAMM|nr:iron-sulfur cluster-binding domain-containing protein [Rheinheimera soli]MDR7119148.1 ferredoxin-NADP reductase [Rheinheimera soli]